MLRGVFNKNIDSDNLANNQLQWTFYTRDHSFCR